MKTFQIFSLHIYCSSITVSWNYKAVRSWEELQRVSSLLTWGGLNQHRRLSGDLSESEALTGESDVTAGWRWEAVPRRHDGRVTPQPETESIITWTTLHLWRYTCDVTPVTLRTVSDVARRLIYAPSPLNIRTLHGGQTHSGPTDSLNHLY